MTQTQIGVKRKTTLAGSGGNEGSLLAMMAILSTLRPTKYTQTDRLKSGKKSPNHGL